MVITPDGKPGCLGKRMIHVVNKRRLQSLGRNVIFATASVYGCGWRAPVSSACISVGMPRLGPQVCCQKIQEKLQELKRQQLDVKSDLRRCRQEKTANGRRHRRFEEVALNLMSQSGGSHALAQEFLERNLAEQDDATATKSIDKVRATYNAMSPTDKEALREPTAPYKSKTPAQAAAKFLREHRLAKWVETRNIEQNIAPVVSLVTQEARASHCLPLEPTSTKQKSQLQWLRRWRRRWNITLGSIPARDNVPPEEARRKASSE